MSRRAVGQVPAQGGNLEPDQTHGGIQKMHLPWISIIYTRGALESLLRGPTCRILPGSGRVRFEVASNKSVADFVTLAHSVVVTVSNKHKLDVSQGAR